MVPGGKVIEMHDTHPSGFQAMECKNRRMLNKGGW